ncbi:MAG: DUF3021 domain-containing protein [Lachnospiraceae bacterium]|nr:DUF3021 domain-containing protein [Lachnospiraceae bacterium]
MLKETLKRGAISFAISAFCGLIINLLIDTIAHAIGAEDFCSISPDFLMLFPTTAMAVYANVLLYGVIGATFSMMTFVYDLEKIGFAVQSIIYFIVTSTVCLLITMLLWQLHRYPPALICSLAGYAVTHIIMFTISYRKLKNDINAINTELE